MNNRLIPIAVAASFCLVAPAASAVITRQYDLTATGFMGAGTAPVSTVVGTFNLTFDNAVTVSQQTVGISSTGLNISLSSTLAFSYIAGADTLIIGGTAATVATSDPVSNDYALVLSKASSLNASVTSFSYTVGSGSTYTATSARVGTSTGVSAVPDGAIWTMMLVGFGCIGVALRSRSRNAATSSFS